jgi:hypothetical protein
MEGSARHSRPAKVAGDRGRHQPLATKTCLREPAASLIGPGSS